MPDLLAPLTTALELADKLRKTAAKIKDADTNNLIAELRLALVDLKIQLAEVQEENLHLREELRQTKAPDDIRGKLELRGGAYWFRDDAQPEGRPAGPYCTRCVDVDGKLVLFQELPSVMSVMGKYRCSNCDAISSG